MKRPRIKRPSLRLALLVLVAACSWLIALLSSGTGALNGIERPTVDARFSIRGPKAPRDSIVLVGVDQSTLEALRVRPPIPRADYAMLIQRLRAYGARLIGLDVVFGGRSDAADDRALLTAIRRDGPVLLGTEQAGDGSILWPANRVNPPGGVISSLAVDSDSGGVLRRMMYTPITLPTFAVRAAQMLGRPVSQSSFPDNHAWINFRGPPGTFKVYPMIDVIRGQVSRQAFAGKAVLVGLVDPLEKDVFLTAASSRPMAGIEVQANALETILDGFPLQPLGGGLKVLLLLLMAALPPLLSLRLASLYVLLASIGLLVVFLVVAQLAFNGGTLIPVSDAILALALSTAGSIAADSLVSRRQLNKLQQFFERMPSPVSDFFISYRRGADTFVANTLRDQLAEKFGPKSVFLDNEEIDVGVPFPDRIHDAIVACHAMLVVIGPDWLDLRGRDGTRRLDAPNDWVRLEIETGLGQDEVTIVPVLYGGAHMPSADDLPTSIRSLSDHNAVVLTGKNVPGEIDELVRSMERGRLRDFAKEPAVVVT